jgi:recombinational DNA repair protein (RecF pathway)
MPGSIIFLDMEQLKAHMSLRTLAYAAITLYLAAVLAEIIKRMLNRVKRPPKAFLLVRFMSKYSPRYSVHRMARY